MKKKLSDFWKSVAEWNKHGLKEVLFPNYKFNKWIFITCLWIMFVVMLGIMARNDWNFENKFYYHCPENSGQCVNPFFNDPTFPSYNVKCPIDNEFFCNQPFFPPGYTIGEAQPEDIKKFPLFVLCLFGCAFTMNHLLYNKRRIKKNDL